MDGKELPAHRGHPDVELLAQLAAGRVEIRLRGFELAAGELPKAAVSFVEGPAADQEAPVVLNDSSEDADS